MQIASTVLGCREPYERRIARPLAEELREEKPVRLFFAGQSEAALGRETDHVPRDKELSTDLAWKESRPECSPLIVKSPGDRTACLAGRLITTEPAFQHACIYRGVVYCQWLSV